MPKRIEILHPHRHILDGKFATGSGTLDSSILSIHFEQSDLPCLSFFIASAHSCVGYHIIGIRFMAVINHKCMSTVSIIAGGVTC